MSERLWWRIGGGRKIYAGQTLSTGRKGAACVSDKHLREESRSLLLHLPPKTSGISLLRLKVCSRQEKKRILLSHTSCCCLLPAASLLLCQVLPYVICLCTEWRENVTSQFGFGRAQSAPGNLDESSHFSPRGARGPQWLLVYSSCQQG